VDVHHAVVPTRRSTFHVPWPPSGPPSPGPVRPQIPHASGSSCRVATQPSRQGPETSGCG
jgi:hypothetical protein